jgi:hypothetical protein
MRCPHANLADLEARTSSERHVRHSTLQSLISLGLDQRRSYSYLFSGAAGTERNRDEKRPEDRRWDFIDVVDRAVVETAASVRGEYAVGGSGRIAVVVFLRLNVGRSDGLMLFSSQELRLTTSLVYVALLSDRMNAS